MNLNQFKALIVLAETGSFSLTAQHLGVSQPAVSFQIRSLEERFGVTLVVRSSRRAELTLEGKAVCQFARKTLAELAALEREIHNLAGLVKGELLLGASTIPGEHLLPRLVGEFKSLHPGAQLTLRIGDSRQVIFWLLNREVELGVVGAFFPHPQLEVAATWQDRLQLLVPGGHPWAREKKITVHHLLSGEFVLREVGSGTRTVLEERLQEKGLRVKDLQIALEVGSSAAALSAVEAGLGVTLVSAWAAEKALALGRVEAVEIEDLDLSRDLYLVHRRQASLDRIVEEFIGFVQKENN